METRSLTNEEFKEVIMHTSNALRGLASGLDRLNNAFQEMIGIMMDMGKEIEKINNKDLINGSFKN